MKEPAPPVIGHVAISASAGSGKTFQLAHRYIRLLACGVPPERIAAFTFSRKAAGEIFDSIVKYLCVAASSAEGAAETSARVGQDLGCERFRGLLRQVLNQMQRLQVGTLDSFTVGVVRSFPMELGLSAECEVFESDGPRALMLRREALQGVFRPGRMRDRAQREFLAAFKQATFGKEEKALQRLLDAFLTRYGETYLAVPDEAAWGQAARIWPGGCRWLEDGGNLPAAVARLQQRVETVGWPPKVQQHWLDYLEAVLQHGATAEWSDALAYFLGKAAPHLQDLLRGAASIKMERTTCELSAEDGRDVMETLRHVVRTELDSALQQTQGLYQVLAQYDALYQERVRRRGRLSFTDCQHLLAGPNVLSVFATPAARQEDDRRLYIDYRLDARLDHWLLDEFQDTSDLQWRVLSNLADEILQDTSGERSFFYVGDVKQAIYGWRGGNARLFERIVERYQPALRKQHLETSFRSAAPIIDAVNEVFEKLPADLPAAAVQSWSAIWRKHACDRSVPPQGYVALLEPDCQGGAYKPTSEDRLRALAAILNDLQPLARGLSAAVLVRTNEQGSQAVDALRRLCPGMPVAHEGRAPIRDNPVVEQLLALVRCAVHPGDRFAWRLLQMGPLWDRIATEAGAPGALSLRCLRCVHEQGFHGLLRDWGATLEEKGLLDAFGRQRFEELLAAAAAVDEEGAPDGNAFLDAVESHKVREAESEGSVRVMTTHQAKGLEFDVVFLPELSAGKGMGSTGPLDLVVARDDATDEPAWCLKMPRGDVIDLDPVLAERRSIEQAEGFFEELCNLYVAMTRAKRALYLLTSFPGKTATAITAGGLVKLQLAGGRLNPTDGHAQVVGAERLMVLYERGEADWLTHHPPQPASAPVAPAAAMPFATRTSQRGRLNRVTPSRSETKPRSAASLFEPGAGTGLRFGSAVHALFERVAWLDETDVDSVVASTEWGPTDANLAEAAVRGFRAAVASPEVQRVLARPEGRAELWRERSFEVVMGGRWISGTFDRVTLRYDAAGRCVSAAIVDYKTNHVPDAASLAAAVESYRGQMELYRDALSFMLRLPAGSITVQLLFTHAGAVVGL